MQILHRFKPQFLVQEDARSGIDKPLFNYRTIWKQSIAITLAVTLIPLLLLGAVDYQVAKKALETEKMLEVERLVSTARRSLTAYLEERKYMLNFLVYDTPYEQLTNDTRMHQLLDHLKSGVGDWVDLGLVDAAGVQLAYAGPYPIKGIDYSQQAWFKNLKDSPPMASGDNPTMRSHTTNVFLGFRNKPHIVLSILHKNSNNQEYILKASMNIDSLAKRIAQLRPSKTSDAFLIDHDGVLQTPSSYYGPILTPCPLAVPPPVDKTRVFLSENQDGRPIIVGYAYITGSPFILIMIKPRIDALSYWLKVGGELLFFLLISVLLIVGVVFAICTYLVNNLYLTDQKRMATLHEVEYASKMASIGRLSAGVAHEINNPLAIINEKAGLLRDLFTFRKEYAEDQRVLGPIDSIIRAVERCAAITRQLLHFSRNLQTSLQTVNLQRLIAEVLEFQTKEAAFHHITIQTEADDDIPEFTSDRGKLQQIFVNLVNNGIAAMKETGGALTIASRLETNGKAVVTTVSDTGCGIPQENIKKIFEPFFTTKSGSGGTGLGLSITYGLVRELGGSIEIKSTVGQGTTFTLTLPLEHTAPRQGDSP